MAKKSVIETSMNEAAVDLFEEMLEMIDLLKGELIETENGSMILDLGLKASGGYLAGEYVTQVCMGGLAEVSLKMKEFDNLTLPCITVVSDFPAIATMGSQFAGWSIDKDGFRAIGSGPARILAKKPKELFERIPLVENFDKTVVVLETSTYPTNNVLKYLAEKCQISEGNLNVIITPTASITGATQISGRSIETAIHKLYDLGMDINLILSACGSAPISPLLTNNTNIMLGKTNDMLIYGSEVFIQVNYPKEKEKELQTYLEKAISSTSKYYGQLFFNIINNAKGNFYQIDPAIFAPAKLIANNISTGNTFTFGKINNEMLNRSFLLH